MINRSESSELLFSREKANEMLSNIAEVLVHYIPASDLLKVYQGICPMTDLKSGSGSTDVDMVLYDLFENNEVEWEYLLRKPFNNELTQIMKGT